VNCFSKERNRTTYKKSTSKKVWWNRLICNGLVTIKPTAHDLVWGSRLKDCYTKPKVICLLLKKNRNTVVCRNEPASNWQRSTPKHPKQHHLTATKTNSFSAQKGDCWKQVLN
jgi:hypothetical protein